MSKSFVAFSRSAKENSFIPSTFRGTFEATQDEKINKDFTLEDEAFQGANNAAEITHLILSWNLDPGS